MSPLGSATSHQGIINTPTTPVIKPPARKEIWRGARWAKSLAGLTTLAAMLVANVAMQRAIIATINTTGLSKRVSTSTGSQMDCPKMMVVAEVTATPLNE